MDNESFIFIKQVVNNELQKAIKLHQSGELDEAENIYKELLSTIPLHQVIGNLAIIHSLKNNFDEALFFYNQAISINPQYASGYSNRGNTLKELKRYEEALASYEKAIEIDPNNFDAYSNQGITLHHLNRFEDALVSYDKAIAINQEVAHIHFSRGNALLKLNRANDALSSYNKAIELKSDYSDAYTNSGSALQALANYEEAMSNYDKALSINPNDIYAYSNKGVLLQELNRFEEAVIFHVRAISINSNYSDGHYNYGCALQKLNRTEEAIDSYSKAIEINQKYFEAYHNKALSLQKVQRFEEAIFNYKKAIELNPTNSESYLNIGILFTELKNFHESIANYEKAIHYNPNHAPAHLAKAILKILLGDYLEGWEFFEWRWKHEDFTSQLKNFTQPAWLGECSLKNKTILIYPEQGLGDYIQFVRYASLLDQAGARVILEVPTALISVISTLKGEFTCIEKDKALPSFDYHCPVMSLPHAFKTTVETIPNRVPYLYTNVTKKEIWQARLGEKTKMRVGFVNSGSHGHKNDHNRSISTQTLEKLFNLPIEFHCLQKEIRVEDASFIETQTNIYTHTKLLNDFSDTAALIDEMDLVISVDTSVAHLAGALGKKTWILLPYVPDYRWMLDRDDSPWYPTATLFRQPTIGNWQSVIDEIARLLEN